MSVGSTLLGATGRRAQQGPASRRAAQPLQDALQANISILTECTSRTHCAYNAHLTGCTSSKVFFKMLL
eukprot:1158672-Pelagomonas_calceolata.AAC.14